MPRRDSPSTGSGRRGLNARAYGEFGAPARLKLRMHVLDSEIDTLTQDGGGSDITRVTLISGVTAPINLLECEVQVNVASSGVHLHGHVEATGTDGGSGLDYIDINDPGDLIFSALDGNAVGLMVLDFMYDSTFGFWTSSAVNTGGAGGYTTLTCSTASFTADMIGLQIQPNLDENWTTTILDVPGSTTVTIAGDADASSVVDSGDAFRIIAAAGVVNAGANPTESAEFALADIRDAGANDSSDPGSRILWAGYWYVPPQVGVFFDPDGEGELPEDTYGTQPEAINLLGSYYCWNRIYSPYLGRWTTPDPAASPFWNLWDYCNDRPINSIDPTGLRLIEISDENLPKKSDFKEVDANARPIDPETGRRSEYSAVTSTNILFYPAIEYTWTQRKAQNLRCACGYEVFVSCVDRSKIKAMFDDQASWVKKGAYEGESGERLYRHEWHHAMIAYMWALRAQALWNDSVSSRKAYSDTECMKLFDEEKHEYHPESVKDGQTAQRMERDCARQIEAIRRNNYSIINNAQRGQDAMDKNYDDQTKHGTVRKKQEEWEKHIVSEVERMKQQLKKSPIVEVE